jgi:hypothetical protein
LSFVDTDMDQLLKLTGRGVQWDDFNFKIIFNITFP